MIVWLVVAQVFIQTAVGIASQPATPAPVVITLGHEHTK